MSFRTSGDNPECDAPHKTTDRTASMEDNPGNCKKNLYSQPISGRIKYSWGCKRARIYKNVGNFGIEIRLKIEISRTGRTAPQQNKQSIQTTNGMTPRGQETRPRRQEKRTHKQWPCHRLTKSSRKTMNTPSTLILGGGCAGISVSFVTSDPRHLKWRQTHSDALFELLGCPSATWTLFRCRSSSNNDHW